MKKIVKRFCNTYEIILGIFLSSFLIIGKNYRNYGSYRVGGVKRQRILYSFYYILLLLLQSLSCLISCF